MQYILEVYAGPDDQHPDQAFESDSPFGAIGVDDLIHPSWRMDPDWPELYHAGDVLRVVRVERRLWGMGRLRDGCTAPESDKTMVYCEEELNMAARQEERARAAGELVTSGLT